MIKKTAAILALAFLISFTDNRQERKLTFVFTEQQTNIILQGLNELPAKTANPIIQDILSQAQKQIQDSLPKKK